MGRSSPHRLGWGELEERFGKGERRRALLSALRERLERFSAAGARVDCVLIGGSFADSGRAPRDLDGLVLYSVEDAARFGAAMEACLGPSTGGADLRYLPADADPVLVVKMISFFTLLYAGFDGDTCRRRSAFILVPPFCRNGECPK
ncbi:MAG: hypothetical protein JOZ90_15545 [Alphaproteobacteria bacterium]|nr:hypothetical protein [Alphaproteobacteria bacterium]MBV9902488.1 hypothetical protein [Alphaproteobacteria bacterium]